LKWKYAKVIEDFLITDQKNENYTRSLINFSDLQAIKSKLHILQLK